jgi:hypothetical protein
LGEKGIGYSEKTSEEKVSVTGCGGVSDPNSVFTCASQFDVFTIGVGYLEILAAMSSTDSAFRTLPIAEFSMLTCYS